MHKRKLQKVAYGLLADWIRANLEAGCVTTYAQKRGLTDEERAYLTTVLNREAGKFALRSSDEVEERDFPLALEYSATYNDDGLY